MMKPGMLLWQENIFINYVKNDICNVVTSLPINLILQTLSRHLNTYPFSLKNKSHLQTQLKEIDFKKDVLPDDLLQTIKSKRLLELTELGRAYDNELVNTDMVINSSLGFKVNADLRSQNNLRGLIDFMTDTETTSYIDYENKAHDLSKSQLEILLKEVVLNGSNLYKQKWNYSKQIKNATNSDDDILLQEFKFTMLNFGE